MSKSQEPNRSQGGTFIRDTSGKLLEHIPPTQPAPPLRVTQSAQPSTGGAPEEDPVTSSKPSSRPAARSGR